MDPDLRQPGTFRLKRAPMIFMRPTVKNIFHPEGRQLFNELLGELETGKHTAPKSPMTATAVQTYFIHIFIFTISPRNT
ncbi:unnamed protein product [Cercopithifilaria johnstoni]|uniref:Uncharacterized protein n=1 Tax=Cercopithifilaria johnstoni TaxID=2874296 RepID=A0A8J2LXI8_9BILA|nr:unnamed protein product [Cercopithifilaria johnstoni]